MWNRVLENVFRKADHIGGAMVGNKPSDCFKYENGYFKERGKRRLFGLFLIVTMVTAVIILVRR